MSDWRIRGYVPDSDEEDDLDLHGAYAIRPPEAKTSHVESTETAKAPIQDYRPEEDDASTQLPESQDELGLDSSQNDLLNQTSLRLYASRANCSSITQATESFTTPVPRMDHNASYRATSHSNDISNGDHELSPEITSASSTNALSRRFLATQLFSDEHLSSTSVSGFLNHSSRKATPILQDGDLDELQQDWPNGQNGTLSALSSPLSEARSDIEPPDWMLSSLPLHTSRDDGPEDFAGRSRQTVQVVIPPQQEPQFDQGAFDQLDDAEKTRIRRALRKRNPIQLHPYLLEAEKYRQNLKARGLKPVNVGVEHQKHHERHHARNRVETQDEDSQDREFVLDDTQTNSLRQSSPVDLPSSPPPIDPATSLPAPSDHGLDINGEAIGIDDDDYEFPDLSVLLRRKHDGSVQEGFKRRKTLHTFSRKGALNRTSSLPQSPHTNHSDQAPQAHKVFDVPPSPPASETLPNQDHLLQKRRGLQLRPLSPNQIPQPPTPAMSSTRRPRQTRVIDPDEDDEPPLSTSRRRGHQRTQSVAVISSDSSSNSSSEADIDKDRDLQKAKRRIKGVLPASWLRLDKRAQENRKPYANTKPPRRLSRISAQRETAMPSVSSRRASPSPPGRIQDYDPILINDDDNSGSDVGDNSTIVPTRRASLDLGLGFTDTFEDLGNYEVQEHDWVDPMLPSASRATVTKQPQRKRQLKLADTIPCASKRPRLDDIDRPSRPRSAFASGIDKKPKTKNQQRPKRQPRAQPPALSIVDAPVFHTLEAPRIPQFLRVAARQARRQPNQGRHSPTNKHIRLQTEADTEDANSSLRDWRAGRVKPSIRNYEGNIAESRPPLSDRAANEQGASRQQKLAGAPKLDRNRPRRVENAASDGEAARQNRRPRLRQIKLNTVPLPAQTSPTPSTTSRQFKQRFSIAHRPTAQKPRVKQPEFRTAQLERPEAEYDSRDRAAAFRKKLSQLDRAYNTSSRLQFRDAWTGQHQNPRLARFLEDDEIAPLPAPEPGLNDVVPSVEANPPPPPKPKRKLKAKVHRVDVETREYRQPSDPIPHVPARSSPSSILTVDIESRRLEGLGPSSTWYSTDFDVSPLWSGTFFHESTIIGSGEFQQALAVSTRDLDAYTGLYNFSLNGISCQWGAWTEDVASEMALLLSSTASRLENAQTTYQRENPEDTGDVVFFDYFCALRHIVRYFSTHLHFLDPVDRRSFVPRMQHLLDSASRDALADLSNLSAHVFSGKITEKIKLRSSNMLLLLIYQVSQIASHSLVDPSQRQDLSFTFKALVKSVLQLVLKKGMGELRQYIDENRRYTAREQGIREDKLAIESFVVVRHLFQAYEMPPLSLWSLIKEELVPSMPQIHHIQSFERLWYDIFALLPYSDIDENGLIQASNRSSQSVGGDWSLVVPLLNRLFTLYPESAQTNATSVNAYLRVCFWRCYNLICCWGWRKCDSLLTTIFDFFSRRGFKHLHDEESKGSPRFLEDLDRRPDLDIQPDDRAFHIFLKTLVTGFRSLRHNCSERQIQNIAWRLVPNHRRTYHKEEDLRQEDLDGLRNQHDLLCTLYWASPPGFRPRLSSLRNLVDQTRSHREVCRLSVRACSRLSRYQISTDEGNESLEPLAEWFNEIISQNLAQYKMARSEAESQYEAARSSGNEYISAEHLQLTIRNNQAQIMATLGDAIYGIGSAIKAAHDADGATLLLRNSGITDVFKLFDAKNSQTNKLIAEILLVFQTYLGLLRGKYLQEESQQTSDDSQDYGGGFSLEDIEPTEMNDATSSELSVDFVRDAVWQLVSSCFGAETLPDDALLVTVVETWSMIARHLVRKGLRGWSSFLDPYNPNSWRQLQDTEQTRKFSALFMSTVLIQDPSSYDGNRDDMLWSWFRSLVERESMLKFQHRLTASLMNRDPNHPLFRNLPFCKNAKTGQVEIRLSEFRQRRLSLISSVLANMRDNYDTAMHNNLQILPELRKEYNGLLKQLMAAMKKNYQDLGQNSETKSAYVEFVQNVVEFLQQHTHDICPVDSFFTDSSVFPLPATDPTYVVGRLKSYVPKLSEQRTVKQLVSFLQNVSERAAIDNEQDYLASQLRTATMGACEHDDTERPTLRQVLLGAIFPAYIEQAFTTTAGWIFAIPLLQASHAILLELDYQGCQYSVSEPSSLATVDSLLSSMLDAMCAATELLITHSGLLEQPHVLHVLALIFDAVAATVMPVAHIYRRTGIAVAAAQRVEALKAFSLFVAAKIYDSDAIHDISPYPPLDPDPLPEEQLVRFREVRQLCARDLKQALGGEDWVRQGEQYLLVRKNGRRVVQTAVGSLEEESRKVVVAIEGFHGALRAALWRGEEDLWERRKRGKVGRWPVRDGEMVVI